MGITAFQGFGQGVIPFFLDLRFHNDRSFMEANRERYIREVRTPFYDFIDAMAPRMLKIDPNMEVRPVKCLSRINRDTRFTKDKSPYRDHLWLAFRPACVGKEGIPFYWFELAPEHVNWGLGIWGENRSAMDAMRRRMAAHPEDFRRLMALAREKGFAVGGPEWKKMAVPPEIPEELRGWYLKKEIFAEKQGVSLSCAQDPRLPERVADDFEALAPFYLTLWGCVEEAMNSMENTEE